MWLLKKMDRLLAQPLILSQSEASMISLGWMVEEEENTKDSGRLGLGDNDKISKIVPQKVNLIPDEDIIQVVKP